MPTDKRESTEVVIEAYLACPGGAVVTAGAIVAEPAAVWVILRMTRCAFDGDPRLFARSRMAILAPGSGMCTLQREARHRIMIECYCFPSRFSVAPGAVSSIAAVVFVVCRVTAETGRSGLDHPGRLSVTGFACGIAVCSPQGEVGHPVMIEIGLAPCSSGVARCAVSAVLAAMRVVSGVAGKTGPRWVLIGVASTVATRATGRGVPTVQREAGAGMIKGRRAPGCGRVALAAIGSAAATMRIIAGMACHATCSQPSPALSGVTRQAAEAAVRPGKSKSCG